MSYTICAIPGDGIGRDVVPDAVAVLQAAEPGLRVEWAEAGFETFRRTGAALPARTLELARETGVTLFGAVSSPLSPTPGYESPILALRRQLNLYAAVRPASSLDPAVRADLIVVRELTEGLYGGGEESDGERAVATRVITRAASRRVTLLALDLARRLGRRRLTIVHKATVLPRTCGLFREAAFDAARDYPEIAVDEMLVDSAALRLAAQPDWFDMIVTTNLFGDILSDVAAMHAGGLGLAPSANVGDDHAVFEPVHGSAPDIAGRGVANPLAAILAGAMLLDHIGARAGAGAVRRAVARVVSGPARTPDMGGSATTDEVTRAVIAALAGGTTAEAEQSAGSVKSRGPATGALGRRFPQEPGDQSAMVVTRKRVPEGTATAVAPRVPTPANCKLSQTVEQSALGSRPAALGV